MGYYSDFSGEFKLSRKPHGTTLLAVKNRIKDAFGAWVPDVANMDYTGSVFYNSDKFTIEPIAANMKGYSFADDVKTVAAILREYGISLKGEVFRRGEGFDDHERFFFKKGILYHANGVVTYPHPKPV